MRKLKVIGLSGLLIVTTLIAISAKQKNIKKSGHSHSYKDISHYGVMDFVNMDLGVIGYFPNKKDWRQIEKKIVHVPIDSLRYIDSLDISKIADTLLVKFYSQNYAYQSENVYKIAKNTNKATDTLMVFHFNYNVKMKDSISSAETFRTKDFTMSYDVKQNIEDVDKRIILNKSYR